MTKTRPPRGPLHPAWFYLLLWLAVAAVTLTTFVLGDGA